MLSGTTQRLPGQNSRGGGHDAKLGSSSKPEREQAQGAFLPRPYVSAPRMRHAFFVLVQSMLINKNAPLCAELFAGAKKDYSLLLARSSGLLGPGGQ